MKINKLTSLVRRCVEDYDMIADGETIAIGVSGGKDSVSLLCALADLRNFFPRRFELHAITLDLGFGDADFSPVARLCDRLDVPYTVRSTDIAPVIFDIRNESNPCSLCAKMRRGALSSTITEMGIKKIALAHHYDDAIETFLMSLIFEGRLHCFQPVTYLDRTDTTQIRPMLYVKEASIIELVKSMGLPVIHNPCPIDGYSKREEVKIMLKSLSETYPDIKSKLFGAIKRAPLKGWGE
jgi:tRNA(Ile)-lysidine synthase TilS/MesJ